MDHINFGNTCFQKQDYLGALQHFTTAIKCSSPKLVPDLINKRSFVYIKLGKFQSALHDGCEIIKRKPGMAMGYLRCGQVLQLMGQPDKALRILECGMSKVKVGGDGERLKLSKHYETLRTQSQTRRRIDPLAKIPKEIAEQIWGYLDINSLGRTLYVSKAWKKFVESFPGLWQDLKIKNFSSAALTAWFKRSEREGYGLRRATMVAYDFNQQRRNQLQLIQRCAKLEYLELQVRPEGGSIQVALDGAARNLKTLILSAESILPLSAVKQIMVRYPQLRHVEFHSVTKPHVTSQPAEPWPEMPNLQSIALHASGWIHRPTQYPNLGHLDLGNLIKAAPNVKSATFTNWRSAASVGIVDFSSWTELTYLDVNKTCFTSIPKFPSTLIHLNVEEIKTLGVNDFESLPKNYFQFPNLKHLSVDGSDFAIALNEMADPGLLSGSLTTLNIGDSSHFGREHPYDGWPAAMPASSATLRTLSLRLQTELREKTIIKMLRQYPNLKEVDLAHTGVTGSTLVVLFERENRPEFIDLEGCDDCYYDAVEAAREAGIEVLHELAPKKKMYRGRVHPTYD